MLITLLANSGDQAAAISSAGARRRKGSSTWTASATLPLVIRMFFVSLIAVAPYEAQRNHIMAVTHM